MNTLNTKLPKTENMEMNLSTVDLQKDSMFDAQVQFEPLDKAIKSESSFAFQVREKMMSHDSISGSFLKL